MLIYCTNNKTGLGCAEDVFVFPTLLEESVENMTVFAVPRANPIAFADGQFGQFTMNTAIAARLRETYDT